MKLKKLFLTTFFSILFLTFFLGMFLLSSDVLALPSNFQKTTVTTNLAEPTDFAIAPDGRIFVTETGGKVKVIQNGSVLPNPFVIVNPVFQGDRGLLGIVLDPDFSTNHFVYLFYTNGSPVEIRVSRFTEANNKAEAGSEKILLKSSQTLSPYHHGGTLAFGNDGKLWISVGDNSTTENSQNLSNIHGKILRINKDGTIPSDNPFVSQPGKNPAIWAYGLRNPFRFSFKPDGTPIIADVGGDFWEEVNLGVKGANYGWPVCEGVCTNSQMTNPIHAYGHTDSGAAIVGGFVYTGNNFPSEYKNNYFFGDYVNGFIKRLTFDGSGKVISEVSFDPEAGTVVSLKPDSQGNLYYLTIFPGTLTKLSYSTANQAPVAKISASSTSADKKLKAQFSSKGSFDPEGKKLSYKWDFGDGKNSKDENPNYTYKKEGIYKVTLVVNDGQLNSEPVSLQVTVGQKPPVVTIQTPTEGAKYNAGQTINYSAGAWDPEDGELVESAFSWNIIFHHDTHIHPFLGPVVGKKSGQFIIPDVGEPSANTWYEIQLTVTDSSGLKTTVSRNISPNKTQLSVVSSPSALQVKIGGMLQITPFTFDSVVGFKHLLEAVSSQIKDGVTYEFLNWSDNGASVHEIITPSQATTYTANFKTSGTGNPITGDFIMNPGEVKTVAIFAVISGDIKVAGEPLYDSDGSTGLVVVLEQDASVEAPWGARVWGFNDLSSAESKASEVALQMKQNGCGSSCNEVKIIKFPSRSVSQITNPITSNAENTPVPTPTPTN